METRGTWDLGLLYSSPQDLKIEDDMRKIERACRSFRKRFLRMSLTTPAVLERALRAYDTCTGLLSGIRPILYFSYKKTLDTQDTTSAARLNEYSMRATKANNEILFFELALCSFPRPLITAVLSNPRFTPYRYFLKTVFDNKAHRLSEAEERILDLKALPAYGLWVDAQEKLLYARTVRFKNQTISLPEAQGILSNLPYAERQILGAHLNAEYASAATMAESELTAVYINKKINDELRDFQYPEDATILGYQNQKRTVDILVSGVKNYHTLSHRFYEIKRKLLKVRKLSYHDRNAALPIGKSRNYPFADSVAIIRDAFATVDPRFRDIVDSFLQNGQIDVYPKPGKEGGAFCSSSYGNPTFVMLNDVGTLSSLSTFAHEMGHAIHSEFSKSQRPLYAHYTMPVAETASTFFENIAYAQATKEYDGLERIKALHDKIQGSISTIFRQIACFRFEQDLHALVRKNGGVRKEELAELHNVRMSEYLGPAVALKKEDGYFAVTWSHIRRFFYVYSYAYGELISAALLARFQENPAYIKYILGFLSAGSSASPEEIFKAACVDTTKPAYITDGMKKIAEQITELERLSRDANLL